MKGVGIQDALKRENCGDSTGNFSVLSLSCHCLVCIYVFEQDISVCANVVISLKVMSI